MRPGKDAEEWLVQGSMALAGRQAANCELCRRAPTSEQEGSRQNQTTGIKVRKTAALVSATGGGSGRPVCPVVNPAGPVSELSKSSCAKILEIKKEIQTPEAGVHDWIITKGQYSTCNVK